MEFETDGRTDAANNSRRLSVNPFVTSGSDRATSTRCDGRDRGGRCCCACLSVRPFVSNSI